MNVAPQTLKMLLTKLIHFFLSGQLINLKNNPTQLYQNKIKISLPASSWNKLKWYTEAVHTDKKIIQMGILSCRK